MPATKTIKKKQLGRTIGRKKANPKNLKKTTVKGAYNKNAKKNFAIRRQPFIEVKRRTQELTATGTALPNGVPNGITTTHAINFDHAYEFVPVWSFCSMSRGINDDQMIGSSVFAKYLKQRIVITLGHGNSTPGVAGIAEELRVLHGWVTAPLNLTAYTTPNATALDRGDLNTHIQNHVKEYFDDRGDPLRFRQKVNSSIKILGNRKVVRKADQYNMAPQAVYDSDQSELVYEGTGDEVTVNCTWPMNKKIHYQQSTHQSGEADNWYYPLSHWLPWTMFYSPRFGATLAGPTYRYNNIFYFSDS